MNLEQFDNSKSKEELTIEHLYNGAALLPTTGRVYNLLKSFYM